MRTFKVAENPTVDDMQVSCIWLDKHVLGVSLNGNISVFSPDCEDVLKVITGHRKPIQDMAVDRENGFVYTCDTDSRIVRTECKTMESECFAGTIHNKTLIKFVKLSCDNKWLYTIGVDDTLVASEAHTLKTGNQVVKLDGAARCVTVGNVNPSLIIVGIHKKKILIFEGLKLTRTIDVEFMPSALCISNQDEEIAVGGQDCQVHIFDLKSGKQISKIANNFIREEVVAVSFSGNGQFLATADRNRHIWIWRRDHLEEPVNKANSFQYHNAIPSAIEWSPDSQRLVSAGHDNSIYVWLNPCEGSSKNIHLDNAFQGSIVNVSFLADNKVVGAGADCTIRFFSVQ
jgi:WD40 repeat protein